MDMDAWKGGRIHIIWRVKSKLTFLSLSETVHRRQEIYNPFNKPRSILTNEKDQAQIGLDPVHFSEASVEPELECRFMCELGRLCGPDLSGETFLQKVERGAIR